MICRKCNGRLDILRVCSRVFMQCADCKHKYSIHEVLDQLDSETEKLLNCYTCLVYD
jgi:hypothetical protein